MNYLAHLALSPDSADARIGNLAGDFLRPALRASLPDAMQDGYTLHFVIDRYTDHHPLVAASKRRIAPPRRRWAGVLVDIFYDHFLARHWSRWYRQTLADFAAQVYQELATAPALPPRLAAVAPIMQHENWLLTYRTPAGVADILQAFSRHRVQRDNPVAAGIADLDTQYAALEADFLAFYPQLIAHVAAPTSPLP